MTKNITIGLIVIVIILIGIFLYATRAPEAPSQSIESVGEENALQTEGEEELFRISQSSSSAEFRIDEVLNNADKTAVGVTNQIAGDIVIDGNTVTIGTISINARTFKTDSERRDGAIVRFILKAEEEDNEFITFIPTNTVSLPPNFGEGASFSGNISGNLTIAGVTKATTFNVSGSRSGNTITGIATANIKRSDFSLSIPNVEQVASVEDEFVIQADITANLITE